LAPTSVIVALIGLLGAPPVAVPSEAPRRIGGGIQAPRRLKSVAPEYPNDARRAGLAGAVVLECTISPEGDVVDAVVTQGVPPLTDAARKAVTKWKYTPTLLDGAAVPVIMTVTVNFKLEGVNLRDLLRALRDRNEYIRAAAARNLGGLRIGEWISPGDRRDTIDALELLAEKDESPRVRDAAARSLTRLDGRPLPPPPVAVPRPEPPAVPAGPTGNPRSLEWGTLVDPLGQARIEERAGSLEIEVPAGTFDLSIELGQVNAPRVTKLVHGDLMAQVTV
jgi:TonB family protein